MKNKLIGSILLLSTFNVSAEVLTITQDTNVVNKIAGAVTGDTIRFFPGTYSVNIAPGDRNLRIEGVDTKNTILKSIDGIKPIIELNGIASSTVIQNLTFLEAKTGILVSDNMAGVSIINNVFRLGAANTAIDVGAFVSADISNNTFYGNLINIVNQSIAIVVKNNIFDDYTTFIGGTLPNTVSFNCIASDEPALDISNEINTQATFVDVSIDVNDLHLQLDSQCIDMGEFEKDFDDSQTDIGVYGGEGYDKIPESILVDSINADDLMAIKIDWLASDDYLVSGYKLYYSDQPIYSAAQDNFLSITTREDTLSVIDTQALLTATLPSTLVTTATIPQAPVLTSVLPGKNKLILTWDAIDNVTFYDVFYVTGEEDVIETNVGNVTSYELTGLTNGVIYKVWLKASNQLRYYFQIAAYIEDPDDTEFTESFFVKEDRILDVGSVMQSDSSNEITKQPESIVAYPNLPNEGCFIATAAFGYYSSTQVQHLRKFRDLHLLTNAPGRSFVNWYYEFGPIGAAFINDYPILKPITRVFLSPLILAAELLEESKTKFFLFLLFCVFLLFAAFNAVISQFRKRVSV